MWKLNTSNMTCGSCKEKDIKITAQHRFDKNISDIKVFPFNTTDYKIYPVEEKYVAAKFGDTSIVAEDNPKICYSLENTNEYIPKMKSLIKGICIGIVDSDISYRFNPDTKELLVGTIGDNYWGGHCTHYKRHILLFVKNKQYLSSVNLTEVGFDDWIQLSIDGTPFYTSPYSLPSDCELYTSFVEHPNIDILSKIKEGINDISMHVIVTGGGEGWFKLKFK
jgi:hypothetical protein